MKVLKNVKLVVNHPNIVEIHKFQHFFHFQSSQPEELDKVRSNVINSDTTQAKILEHDLDSAKRTYNLNNALFWGFSSLWWQSPDAVPKCTSSRIMACGWAAASVIFICCYTANLISFVAEQSKSDLVIEERFRKYKANDMSVDGGFFLHDIRDSGLEYDLTTTRNSLIEDMLEEAGDDELQETWDKLKVKINFKNSASKEGKNLETKIQPRPTISENVLNSISGDSSFIWESDSLDSIASDLQKTEETCERLAGVRLLKMHDSGLVRRAMGFRKNSPILPSFDNVLQEMEENGDISRLKDKWLTSKLKTDFDCDELRIRNLKRQKERDLHGDFKRISNFSETGTNFSSNTNDTIISTIKLPETASLKTEALKPPRFSFDQLFGIFMLIGIAICVAFITLTLEWVNAAYVESRQSSVDLLNRPTEQLFSNRLNTSQSTGLSQPISIKKSISRHAKAVWRWNIQEAITSVKLIHAKLTHSDRSFDPERRMSVRRQSYFGRKSEVKID